MAPTTKPMHLLAAGLLLALAGSQPSQELAISVDHNYKQQEPAALSYRARALNDDLHLPAEYSSYANYKQQYQQQQLDKQQQRERALDSGRAVINGNHATYVEPPADFKPIIYEPAATAPSLSGSDAPAAAAEPADSANQVAARPHQHSTDVNHQIAASGLSQQAQDFKRLPGAMAGALPAASNQHELPADETQAGGMALDSEQPLDANELPLKPSIGRWSDWHDMSIEPDLAASDSQLEPVSASANVPQSRKGGLKTRYGSGADFNAIKFPGGVKANALKRQQQSAALQLALGVASESQRVHRQRSQASDGPLRLLALNPEGPRNDHLYAANLISLQQAPGVQYASAPHWQQQQHQPPFYVASPAFVQTPPSPVHFLMAHNQHQHQHQNQHHQFTSMRRSHFGPPAGGQQQDNLFVQRRHHHHHLMAQPNLIQLAPAVRRNAEVRLIQAPAPGRLSDAGSQVNAPLMSQKEAPRVFSLGESSRTVARPAGGQVSGSVAPSNKLANGNRSAANSTAATSKPRVLKRRRIKTQLPVGLSSWMLGGIRDLDARHWKLPAEVISKLAVNDVDLAHPDQPAATGGAAFAAFEDSTTDLQAPTATLALERAGPPLVSSSTTRVPSGSQQQIPR